MKKLELLAVVLIIVAVSIMGWILFMPSGNKGVSVSPPVVLDMSQESQAPSLETDKFSQEEEPVLSETATELPAGAQEMVVPVRVAKVKAKDFQDTLTVLGTVKGFLEIELKFEINGVINDFKIKEGARVRKGDVIAILDDKDSRLKVEYAMKKYEAAKAQAASAVKRKEIFEGLYKAGAIIKQKLEEAMLEADAANAQIGMAEAEVALAQGEAKKNFLIAPKDGIIGTKEAEEGEFITPQNKIVSLYELDKVYVELGIVERDIEKVRVGQKAEVRTDSRPDKVFIGRIENLLPIIEGRSRTLTAKVLVENPESMLLPGMFSRSKVYLTEISGALLVPNTSILSISKDVNVVPIVIPDPGYSLEDIEKGSGTARIELRKVELGYESTDYKQVASGISDGDLIVVEARGELRDGLKVKVVGVEDIVL